MQQLIATFPRTCPVSGNGFGGQRLSVAVMRATFCLATFLALTGCVHFGPGTVRKDNFDYNKAILESANQQILLNLVRMRYNDPWMFLGVNSVVTQYEFRGNASASPSFANGQGFTSAEGELGVGYSERPTITYAPLQGSDFARVMLTPIPPDVLIYLAGAGWEVKALLLSCAESVNGLKNAHGGPTWMFAPETDAFKAMLEALQTLQRKNAFEAKLERDEKGQPKVLLVLNKSADPEVRKAQDELRGLLELDPSRTVFPVVSGIGENTPNEIRMQTRPLLGLYYFFAQAIEVPEAHVQQSQVIVTRNADGSQFDWAQIMGKLFRVRASKEAPAGAFLKVKHRGYWFFIPDDDPLTKQTYSLVNLLTLLQSSGQQGKSPLLTISAGP